MLLPKQSSLIVGALAILLAAILKNAPGCPEWVYELPNGVEEENSQLVRFKGGDGSTILTGRLHHPTPTNKAPPIIVLAQGLGLTQDCSLDVFVEAYTSAGFAAFTFDYANFGASDGFPRHDVIPSHQIADINAAIDEIQRNDSLHVDKTKVGLWGHSFGGGHVLNAAAYQNPSIRAVVALVPNLAISAKNTRMESPTDMRKKSINMLLALMKWAFLQITGKTWYVPLHGQPGSAAVLQNVGDDEGYGSLIVKDGGKYGWRNALTIPSVFRLLGHRPIDSVSSIRIPALLIAAENDAICPAEEVIKAAKLIEGAEVITFPGLEHFDVFSGDALKSILSSTTHFFKQHLD